LTGGKQKHAKHAETNFKKTILFHFKFDLIQDLENAVKENKRLINRLLRLLEIRLNRINIYSKVMTI